MLWAPLQGTVLGEAQLQGANLGGAQLQGATLAGAQFQGANLAGAELQGADLRRAQLQGANLRRAQLQGADVREAQLQGVDLRGASIGGADFEGASLDLADLSGLNRAELTQNDYQKLSRYLERDVGDRELLARILEGLKTVIGRKDTLNKAKSAEQCLAHDPELIDLRCTNQLAQYRIELHAYLVKLACTDPHIAFSVSMRLSHLFKKVDLFELTAPATDQEIGLAKAFLQADCAPINELPKDVKEGLRKVVSGG